MKKLISSVLTILIFGSCNPKAATSLVNYDKKQIGKTQLEDDMNLLNEWFAGEFNNFQQVHKEKEDSIVTDLVHENIHSIFEPITLPWLGEKVYYVKQYMDNDPSKIYRQRIYNFNVNKNEEAIQLDIYSFKDKPMETSYINGDKDKSIFSMLKKDDLTSTPGCEVFWKNNGDHFIGYMKERACTFLSKRSGKRIFITDSLVLTKNEIWIRDEAEDEDGNYIFGHKGKIPHKLKRVTYYTGWAATKKEGAENMEAIRGLKMHNQGDRQKIFFADGSPTDFELRLAKLIYGKGLEVLQLGLYKVGAEKPTEYLWTDPESKRIGLNVMGVFQTGLTLEGSN
jgi:hypothetical protein